MKLFTPDNYPPCLERKMGLHFQHITVEQGHERERERVQTGFVSFVE